MKPIPRTENSVIVCQGGGAYSRPIVSRSWLEDIKKFGKCTWGSLSSPGVRVPGWIQYPQNNAPQTNRSRENTFYGSVYNSRFLSGATVCYFLFLILFYPCIFEFTLRSIQPEHFACKLPWSRRSVLVLHVSGNAKVKQANPIF